MCRSSCHHALELAEGVNFRGVPGACDRGYFRGEGREAGEVGRWLENPPGKIFRQDLPLLVFLINQLRLMITTLAY
jgi:hypothetical protein